MNMLTQHVQENASNGPKTHCFKVSRIETESTNIKSFWLSPIAGKRPEYVPGEYLVFEVPAGEGGVTEKREYSISGATENELRVSIKRELRPEGTSHPDGKVSTYFHDDMSVGSEISAFGPTGKFLLDRASDRPVVLLSGGVGQTPLVAMAHELAQRTSRKTYIVHACENGEVHALRGELEQLASQSSNLNIQFIYRSPTDYDRAQNSFDSEGVVTAELLQALLPIDDYEFYLCGPSPFMQAMYALLLKLGVSDARILYEFFGPATIMKPTVTTSTNTKEDAMSELNADQPVVRFAKSDVEVNWDPALENLLDFAEEHGLMPDFSCRAGTCDSCKTKLIAGETEYVSEPMERPSGDNVLICCSAPTKDITLDL